MINIGINGLGRIGRVLLRQIINSKKLNLVCVNDINPDINNLSYLIKYDSTYGRLKEKISVSNNNIIINKKKLKFFVKIKLTLLIGKNIMLMY